MRLRSFAPLILLFVSGLADAQSLRTYAGEFLGLGVGARSLALGGAGVAISTDATAGYWNPAGLNALQYPMAAAMHESRFGGTVQYDYGAIGIPVGSASSAALSILHLGISDIKDTRTALVDLNKNGQLDPDEYLDYNKVSTFGNYDWVALLSFAKQMTGGLSYGANAKLIYRRLDPQTTGTGLGFDVGARYSDSVLSLGAMAQDITTTLLSYSTGTKELVAPTLKLGGAYLLAVADSGFYRVLPTIDADVRFDSRGSSAQVHAGALSADLHLGAEIQIGSKVSLRGGFDEMKHWSAGAGLAFGRLHIDYAFLSAPGDDQLGNTHRVSLTFSLEQPKWKRQ
jgi:hypothetical protein